MKRKRVENESESENKNENEDCSLWDGDGGIEAFLAVSPGAFY